MTMNERYKSLAKRVELIEARLNKIKYKTFESDSNGAIVLYEDSECVVSLLRDYGAEE